MSGDIEGTKRVRDALDFTLKPVLQGFVEANMKARHGQRWLHYASRAAGQEPNDPLDVYGLLKTVLDNWQDIFGDRFERKVAHKARRLFSQAFDARNTVSHLDLPLSDADALSYLYVFVQLGALLKAPQPFLTKLKEAYDAQRSTGLNTSAPTSTPAASVPPPPAPKLDLAPPPDAAPVTGTLKPWIEIGRASCRERVFRAV